MARVIPVGRLRELLEVATAIFIEGGYRQTRMADIAAGLGVAKGTLYGYVESKEALFDAALRFADRLDDVPSPESLPLRSPSPGATVAYVRGRIEAGARELRLVRIAGGAEVIDRPEDELAEIIGDLYRTMSAARHTIQLVDRCARDFPGLHDVWFGQGRWAQHVLLVAIIERGMRSGSYRRVVSVDICARLLLETVAFWAVHRHFDPSPQQVDDHQVERALIEHFTRSLVAGVP